MKKLDTTWYFWVFKTFAFLGMVWSAGILQGFYQFVTEKSETIPWEVARVGQDSMEAFWSSRVEQLSQPNFLKGNYTPHMYFADYREARSIWIRVTGDSTMLIGNSQKQFEAMEIMQSSHPSRIAIDAGYHQFIEPIRPPSAPIDWSGVWWGLLVGLARFYWLGLPFAGILFVIWMHENVFFRRFAGNFEKLMIVIFFWPLFMWLIFKRKFEDHYYSIVAEAIVRRTRRVLSGALTRAEELLVRDLQTNRVGLRKGARILLARGYILRHGVFASLLIVCALRASATVSGCITFESPSVVSSLYRSTGQALGVQNNEHVERNMFCRTGNSSLVSVVYAHSYGFVSNSNSWTSAGIYPVLRYGVGMKDARVVLAKIYFHYAGRLLQGFVRSIDPVPWIG